VTTAAVAAAALLVWFLLRRSMIQRLIENAQRQADATLKEAQRESETSRKEAELAAKEWLISAQAEFERTTKDKRGELQNLEHKLQQKEDNLERKLDLLATRERELDAKLKDLDARSKKLAQQENRIEVLVREQQKQLERISGMTRDEAKRQLTRAMERDARTEAAGLLRKIEDEARKAGKREAQRVIAMAMQRCASDYVLESTVTVVPLPNDEMKGRIIGREGRNIRALELATGVDLIVDDTPEAVLLSSYDPLRREITKIALERLVANGRIHPARIEEVVAQVKGEIEQKMIQDGEEATLELALQDIHPELQKLIGKLRYRTSYGQNILNHSKEVAFLAGVMAEELGCDPKLARRAGLLHDIGKAIDKEVKLGQDLCRRYNENEHVINAVAYHHFECEPSCVESVLVQIADALSAARPGARREILETYLKRLEKLETIADSFQGVVKAFAIQAGREIRIIVESDKISDDDALWLAKDVAKRIESEMEYPGEIKVTVIRETRAVEYAR
jgi:ribonuclease Y